MSRRKNISKFKSSVSLVTGILAASVILFTQIFYFDYAAENESKVKTEQSDNTDEDQTILKIGSEAVAQVAQVSLQNVLHFISNIYLDNSQQNHIEYKPKPLFNAYFHTLFRLIISPNAP
ncbi:MAG: hypothetical protein RLO12_06565 [Fulvivirga sp.]|uniref:hypothetical protein n=1 Tax=Fulvivirga sp. TaxID=1931237 RepID=UPI0032F2A572